MSKIFQFKQFAVDQTGCAMKINTDGVLLGAISNPQISPQSILDIGTGTGVIALMLAQRFKNAAISAVEIDEHATQTANHNFQNSQFGQRLKAVNLSFQAYFSQNTGQQFDLIVSNPPFHLHALESKAPKKSLAKHTGLTFFKELLPLVERYLNSQGEFWVILPPQTALAVKKLASSVGLQHYLQINISSFRNDEPHREILAFNRSCSISTIQEIHIYEHVKVYSVAYTALLKDFFTIF